MAHGVRGTIVSSVRDGVDIQVVGHVALEATHAEKSRDVPRQGGGERRRCPRSRKTLHAFFIANLEGSSPLRIDKCMWQLTDEFGMYPEVILVDSTCGSNKDRYQLVMCDVLQCPRYLHRRRRARSHRVENCRELFARRPLLFRG